jgi:DNA-binding GntR family transcriptional regulator
MIMHGELKPGQSVTIRGLASKFGVSMTPARDAVRRLSAEGALSISSTGRVGTPELSNERIEELASIRALLEPELASRALPRAHLNLLERLSNINSSIDQAIVKDDAVDYIRRNLEFHRTLYLRAQAPAMLALVETVWLQLGPTMRSLYSQLQRREASHNHRLAIAALKVGDEPSLKLAIRADVTQGLRMLTNE